MSTTLKFLLLFCFYSFTSFSQNSYIIKGNVFDASARPIEFASVLLLLKSDSTLVKGTVTEENGSFQLEASDNTEYLLSTSMIGFENNYSKSFILSNDLDAGEIILIENNTLTEVVIKEKKPLYSHKVDRMVINVENSIVSAGGSVLEILEKSPGVLVNRQNNSISIVGKEGVVVMINGKASYVPANAVVQFLQGMSSNNLESIELLTTPPANFDAEGNAGFINIVLKKRLDLGLNGSYTLSFGYGNGAVSSDNISFNYRNEKVNLFGSYSFLYDSQGQFFSSSRKVFDPGVVTSTYTGSERDPLQRNHNVRIGLDYELSENTITGFLLNANDNKWSMDAFNQSSTLKNELPFSYVNLDNYEINHWKHFGANYNIKHTISKTSSVSFDADYLHFNDDNPNDYTNRFFNSDNVFTHEALARSTKLTPIKTWVAKADYTNKLSDKLNVELGVKGTTSAFNNDVAVTNLENGTWVIDPGLTSSSVLDEQILAAYSSADWNLNAKTSFKMGLRYEYTNSILTGGNYEKLVDRQYGILFPTFYINRKINDKLNMNWSYSKRITRPTFNDLAPFVILFDPTTFISGNAALQPAITNAFKYDVTYNSYYMSLQYSFQDSSISNFQERIEKTTGRLIFEAANLDYTRTYSATFGIPLEFTKWWKTQNNLSFVYQNIRAYRDNKPAELNIGNYQINSSHFFKISESISSEFSGFYSSPGAFGIARYNEVYGFNVGFQKTINDKWGSLKFSINDILNSFKFTGGTKLEGQNFETKNTFDFSNRVFTFTWSKNFGSNKVKSKRERETGAEEERRRVN